MLEPTNSVATSYTRIYMKDDVRLWLISGHFYVFSRCRFAPESGHSGGTKQMSAKGQKRTQSKLKDRLAAVFQEVRSTRALTQACASAKRELHLLPRCGARDLQCFVRDVESEDILFFQIGNVILHGAAPS